MLLSFKDAIGTQLWGRQGRLDSAALNKDMRRGSKVLRKVDSWATMSRCTRWLDPCHLQSQVFKCSFSLTLILVFGCSRGADEFAGDGEALAKYQVGG